MKKTQRLAAVGALAALTFSIAACSSGQTASTATSSSAAAPTTSSSAAATSSAAGGSADGVTTIDQIFGPACSQVPATGAGSAAGMVSAAVGTAASNNPLFTTLTAAVTKANLVSTLNDTSKAFTVFGPIDSAFAALPAGTLDTLLADPAATDLTKILTYHVIPKRYDAAGLVAAGSVTSVQGGKVTITGTADAPLINGNAVLCGNIPTANATVFAIGAVLSVPAA